MSLEQTLAEVLSHDNNVRKKAELALGHATRGPDGLGSLLAVATDGNDPYHRQLAALVMRRRIPRVWGQLSGDQQEEVRKRLLDRLPAEQKTGCGTALSFCVAAVSRMGPWPVLPSLMSERASDEAPGRRMGRVLLCNGLVADAPDVAFQLRDAVLAGLTAGLTDSDPVIACTTARAVLEAVETAARWQRETEDLEVEKVAGTWAWSLAPSLARFVQSGVQDAAGGQEAGVESLGLLLGLEPRPRGGVAEGVRVASGVGTDRTRPPSVRARAATVVGWATEVEPRVFSGVQSPLQDSMLLTFSLLNEEAPDENDLLEGGDQWERPPVQAAADLLECIADVAPSSVLLPALFGWMKEALSTDRASALSGAAMSIVSVCRGCRDDMMNSDNLAFALQLVERCLSRSEIGTREAGCLALCRVVECLQPAIYRFSEGICKATLAALSDRSPRVCERGCSMLEEVAGAMSDALIPLLPSLLERMSALLFCSDLPCRVASAATLAPLADAMGSSFLPHAEGVLSAMERLLTCSSEPLQLRARAAACVGSLAVVMGRERIEPHAERLLMLSFMGLGGFTGPQFVLRAHAFQCWGGIASALGPSCSAHLQTILPPLLEALKLPDGEVIDRAPSGIAFQDSDNDEVEDGLEGKLHISAEYLEEKSTAMRTLARIATAVGTSAMGDGMDSAWEACKKATKHIDPGVRGAAMVSMASLLSVKVKDRHPSSLTDGPTLMQAILVSLRNDPELESVSETCDALALVARMEGVAALLEPFVNRLSKALCMLLKGKAMCQGGDDDDDDDDSDADREDQRDHDHIMIDAAADAVSALAEALGPRFAPHWPRLLKELLKYLQKGRPASDHIMALGTLAGVAEAVGAPCVRPWFREAMSAFSKGLLVGQCGEGDREGALSNAAFGSGILLQMFPQDSATELPRVLERLHPLLDRTKHSPRTVDNAVSAVVRIGRSNCTGCPWSTSLPVVLPLLPLVDDMSENQNVYGALITLVSSSAELFQSPQMLRELLSAAARILALPESRVGAELFRELANSIGAFLGRLSPNAGTILAQMQLPPAEEQILQRLSAHSPSS